METQPHAIAVMEPDAQDPDSQDPDSQDPVVSALQAALRLSAARTGEPCTLFARAIEAAIDAHLAHTRQQGDGPAGRRTRPLTRWQERRAKEFLARSAGDDVSVVDVAAVCKLSRSHFARAFKESTGETPHRWLRRYRVEQAKELLLGPLPIAEIALACGFADQSHLTRAFAKLTGLPPGNWRREYRDAPDASAA